MIAAQSPALTNAIAAINAVTVNGDEPLQLIAAKCRALMVGYDKRYSDAGYAPIEVEQTTVTPMLNPATGRQSRLFNLGGKLDLLCQYGSQRILIDHKSTSMDIQDPASPYWRQLVIEGQASHYMLLKWINGEKVDGCVWDVMRKPQTSPKKLSKAEVRSVVASQEYFGRRLSMASITAAATTERETPEMYEARLARDCTNERPEWFFQRRPVPRIDADILEYARDLWKVAREISVCRNEVEQSRHRNPHEDDRFHWPPVSSGACMQYGSPCKFLGICSKYDSPDSDRWQVKQQVHSELPELTGDGRDLLTTSRIRCFQTCKRKHFFQYELGIERVDEEEREALLFGTVWHEGLRAWWETYLGETV